MSWSLDAVAVGVVVFNAGVQYAALRAVRRDLNGVGKRGLKTLCFLVRHAPDAEATRELANIIEGK